MIEHAKVFGVHEAGGGARARPTLFATSLWGAIADRTVAIRAIGVLNIVLT